MKINENQRFSSLQAYRAGNSPKDARVGMTGKTGPVKDQVVISSEAKELLVAEQTNTTKRTQNIEGLKQAVQSGTYKVNTEILAEKLLPYLM
jgi:negative regulator of flagellin synthesis FlgM